MMAGNDICIGMEWALVFFVVVITTALCAWFLAIPIKWVATAIIAATTLSILVQLYFILSS